METICQELELENGYKIESWHFEFTKRRAEESHSCNTFIVKTMGPLIFTTFSELLKMEVGRKPAVVCKVLANKCKKCKKQIQKSFFINESGLRNGKSKIGDNEINATVSSSSYSGPICLEKIMKSCRSSLMTIAY